MRAVSGERFYQ
jgi:hypothetical protein